MALILLTFILLIKSSLFAWNMFKPLALYYDKIESIIQFLLRIRLITLKARLMLEELEYFKLTIIELYSYMLF